MNNTWKSDDLSLFTHLISVWSKLLLFFPKSFRLFEYHSHARSITCELTQLIQNLTFKMRDAVFNIWIEIKCSLHGILGHKLGKFLTEIFLDKQSVMKDTKTLTNFLNKHKNWSVLQKLLYNSKIVDFFYVPENVEEKIFIINKHLRKCLNLNISTLCFASQASSGN